MKKQNQTVAGIYHANPKGFGFVTPADGGSDWFVPRGMERGAWDGDAVELLPTDLERRAGRVTAVTTRVNTTVTGILRRDGRVYYLEPDSPRLTHTILLTGKAKGVSPGQRGAVEMVSFGSPAAPPMGALKEIFGAGGTLEAAQAAILWHYEVTPGFDPQVEAEAAALPRQVEEDDLRNRTDFRDWTVVTIDSQSAKDLDDAVSLTADSQGRRVLGVHIADVSHYVQPKTLLDQEAFRRGTSVYYVNQVAPMLPTALSNGICSLNPRENRLTLSCLMTLDEGGQVIDHKLTLGIIRTKDRLNYDEVNAFLAGQTPTEGAMAHRDIQALVTGLDALARQRVKLRRQRGALELSSGECCFVLDEAGQVVELRRRLSGRGESLIEECMLLANETVARHLCDGGLPGVFRVHERPPADKAEGLRHMLAPLGYDLKDGSAPQLQKLLDHYKDTPMESAVSMMVLRSLMKARYDEKNLGHFGLGADYYCHFTSPIRRYPDLCVHRILTAALTGGQPKALSGFTAQAARQSSERELAAQSAEREIEKLYLARFMSGHIGETFPAAVTGLTRFGLFAGLANGVEGMVPVEALGSESWLFDEDRQTLTGAVTGTVYTLGTPLSVRCVAADESTGRVDFVLAENDGITPGIIVHDTHRLDKGRGKPSWSKRSKKGYSPKGGKRRNSRR